MGDPQPFAGVPGFLYIFDACLFAEPIATGINLFREYSPHVSRFTGIRFDFRDWYSPEGAVNW